MEEEKKVTKAVQAEEFIAMKDLLIKTWEIFKEKIGKYLGILGIQIGVIILYVFLLFVFFAITLGTSIDFSQMRDISSFFESLNPASFGIFWLVFILMTLGLIFFNVATSIATVFLIDGKEENSIGNLIKKGSSLVLPLIGVGALVSLLSLGGLSLLIIPGFVISLMFIFARMEVMLGGKKGIMALKSSCTMMKQNFWEVVGKQVLLFLIAFGIEMVFGIFDKADIAIISPLFSLIEIVFSIVLVFFNLVFSVLLYKETKKRTDFKKESSVAWAFLLGILGLIVNVLILVVVTKVALNSKDKIKENIWDEFENESQKEALEFGKKDNNKNGVEYEMDDEIYDDGYEDYFGE